MASRAGPVNPVRSPTARARQKAVPAPRAQPVFHGVHMLFDAKFDREWHKGEARTNTLVFIGKNLDRPALTEAFKTCLV